ncbi:GTPase Era [Zavarzinia compransoris]|uniref:GTPase Era n=1 Tax=Zavarzinia compransoris TaxID=1264899 RepID=A0A317EAJ8_9PROT|nr:GTPase Era [Zavarzinia compransoris]PWR23582.1 GTPase Era [Zavarzinia compransoris]TDP47799.1 GTP-binding protein Era [Zavarzinia compransoris]
MTDNAPSTAAGAPTRAGFVAIVGPTNAGKSTLTNRLVGTKVSIVTQKVQTTRTRVTGIVTRGTAQIVFVDTPGVFSPRRRLDRAMVAAAWAGAADADLIVVVVDAERGIDDAVEAVCKGLKDSGRKALLALNKIDLVKRETLLGLAQAMNERIDFDATFMISASGGAGCDDLMAAIEARLPEGPWLFPEDQLSDLPERMLAAEVTREKIYLRLHQELPYSIHVETESWKEQKDGSVRIEQVIYVERDGQKAIVLGKRGATAKIIGSLAREELEAILGRRVHLFLFVKVRADWANDRERFAAMGLDWQE